MRNISLIVAVGAATLVNHTFAQRGGGSGGGGGGGGGGGSSGGSRGSSSSGGSWGTSGSSGNRGGSGSGSSSGSSGSSGSKGGSGGVVPVVIGSPDIPDIPNADPGSAGDPGDDEPAALTYTTNYYGFLPAQEQLQEVMGSLELNMTQFNTTAPTQIIEKIVQVILSPPTCSPTTPEIGLRIPSTITQPCTSPKISSTPTSPFPTTAFAACTDYASLLQACAARTPSFYALPASQQLSCACYTERSTYTTCSAPGTYTHGQQDVIVQTRAFDHFDGAANACYNYFARQGYKRLANALYGRGENNEAVLRAGMCRNIASEAERKAKQSPSWSSELSVPSTLDARPISECRPVWNSEFADDYNSGGESRMRVGSGWIAGGLVVMAWSWFGSEI